VVTVAAGNSAAAYGPRNPVLPASFAQDYPGALAVSATNAADTMANFSNYGEWAHIAAPGHRVLVTYRTTSHGASRVRPSLRRSPPVLRGANPEATARQVADALMAGADQLPALAGLTRSGRLNVDRALDAMAGTDPVARRSE
jgi:hypothetical protein